jgi:two-component system chemotaxis response regulator CheV
MSLVDNIDAVTGLADNNELQLLIFRIREDEDAPYYGINVFKTREVINAKDYHLTLIPSAHPMLEGTIILRGLQVPIINLPSWLKKPLTKETDEQRKYLICDFNGIIIGLSILVAYRVIKRNWSEMHAPDGYSLGEDNLVINDTRLDDGELCLILDYERLLAEVIPSAMVDVSATAKVDVSSFPAKLSVGTTLIAEDSKVAQQHLEKIFNLTGLNYKIFDNGAQLMKHINAMPDKSKIPVIITDIEMPEMSGFTVIKMLREDLETKNVPIIVNSSMSGSSNKRKSSSMGADGFIDKTKSKDIIELIIKVMREKEESMR